jgi:hypothetical protein
MLAITGGRERTEREYGELLAAAGFELEEVVQTPGSGQIAILLGFDEPSSFVRAFHTCEGAPPSRGREGHIDR